MTYKDFVQLAQKARKIDTRLSSVSDERKDEITSIREAADVLFQQRYKELLSSMSVDKLSQGKQGIRIAYLKNAGIENIYQLSLMNYSQIRSVEGIGTQNAKKINNLKHEVLENAKKSVSLRINTDCPTPAEYKLLRAVCIFLCHDEIRENLKPIFKAHHNELLQELAVIENVRSELFWAVMPEAKKDAVLRAASSIKQRLSGSLGTAEDALSDYAAIEKEENSVYLSHFKSFASFYYTTIEKYCKKLTSAQKIRADVSADFVKEVDKHPVNLSQFKATLRPYQLFGVKYILHQKKALLGDEMGLGKTVQAIAAMVALNTGKKNHFFVVCPAGVIINWVREFKKFSSINVTKIQGEDTDTLDQWLKDGGVAVASYETLTRLKLPNSLKIKMMVADEAHYVKNPEAQRTIAVKKLIAKSEYVLYMTGTPLINRVDEMLFLIECLQPETAQNLEMVKTVSTAEQFRHEAACVYLRRVCSDVAKELPDIIQKDQWVTLTPEENQIYIEKLGGINYMDIRKVSWNVDDVRKSSKANRLSEICKTAKEQNRKIIVFSYFLDTIDMVCQLLDDTWVKTISGKDSPVRRQKIIDEFSQAPAGAVLVSQITAGGTGLNIQAASVVVFCEPQLTPAAEEQALKRAHRMGQTRDVLVYRLIADDTIDERILEILDEKKASFDTFADDSIIGDMQLKIQKEKALLAQAVEDERKRLSLQ